MKTGNPNLPRQDRDILNACRERHYLLPIQTASLLGTESSDMGRAPQVVSLAALDVIRRHGGLLRRNPKNSAGTETLISFAGAGLYFPSRNL